MTSTPPPIRALLPGRCYRYEAIDASHASEFFQVEGLMVDEGTTMADLKGLLDQFAKAMFGADKRTRFRPGYYPFTEPSVAFDVECLVCGGSGCPACSRTGWMTILGAGMVHPVVLQYGGLDPERYQGFAFGMGVERIANLRHAVGDLRLYMENDLRFLDQFVGRGRHESPAVLAARLRRRRPRARAARRAADAARDGGQGHRALGRRLAERRRRRAPDRREAPARRPAVADDRQRRPTAASRSRSSAARRTSPPGSASRSPCPGAVLPGDRRIERTEKMGVVSNGMLCSGDELNLTSDADGILILPPDAPLGVPLSDLYGDVVLDVDVKPNRGDALSLIGLAREVAAITGAPLRWPETIRSRTTATSPSAARRRRPRHRVCTRFVGRWVAGVTVGPSPDRVQMRLRAAGMRPISNVVDASNYVMLELGKPTHTFDADGVASTTRAARSSSAGRSPGERLETIDHVVRDARRRDAADRRPAGPARDRRDHGRRGDRGVATRRPG